jgi:hypothetical protein
MNEWMNEWTVWMRRRDFSLPTSSGRMIDKGWFGKYLHLVLVFYADISVICMKNQKGKLSIFIVGVRTKVLDALCTKFSFYDLKSLLPLICLLKIYFNTNLSRLIRSPNHRVLTIVIKQFYPYLLHFPSNVTISDTVILENERPPHKIQIMNLFK